MSKRKIAAALLAAALAVPTLGLTAAAAEPKPNHGGSNPWLDRQGLNIAHQGGELEAPSDTLYAFKTANEKGADVLELDVHATKDGKLVVMHDDTVDRATNGTGRIDAMTLKEIKSLDAAHWYVPDCGNCHDKDEDSYIYRGLATGDRPMPPELEDYEPNDFKVPTLREVLKAFPDKLLNIEIKATAPDTKPYERKVAWLLWEFGRTTDTIVASFNDDAISQFKRWHPCASTSPGINEITKFWQSSQGDGTGIPLPGHHALQVPIEYQGLKIVTEDFVKDAHANNLAVHVWTVDDREQMEWLLDIGVDGIMTNRPTLLEEVLESRNTPADAPDEEAADT